MYNNTLVVYACMIETCRGKGVILHMSARFQLRHAAGIYWLLDMEQEIGTYKKPLPMNEAGAEIFKLMQEGKKQKFSVYEAALKASQATCTENCPAFQSEQEDRQYGYPGAGL